MRFGYVVAGVIFAIVGYTCGRFTMVTVDWQTTRVLFWKVNMPIPGLTQPFAFLTIPLYFLAAICILYGLFSRGEPK